MYEDVEPCVVTVGHYWPGSHLEPMELEWFCDRESEGCDLDHADEAMSLVCESMERKIWR